MKRVLYLAAALLSLLCLLTGCGKGTVTGVGMKTQDYSGGDIFELPHFEGKGDTPEQLNDAIRTELAYYIQGWQNRSTEDRFYYELRSYPICGQRYKQVVITAIELPNQSTDGDVFSYCYDTKSGRLLTLDDALGQAGVSRETVQSKIGWHVGDYLTEGDTVAFISCEAFTFAGGELCVIARAFIENDLSDGRDELFAYYAGQDVIQAYDHGDLFPSGLCDQLEPPLSYGQ